MAVVPQENDEPGTTNDAGAGGEKTWNWQEHIPLLIAGVSILFIGVRLLSISHDDFETADGILQASGTATIIIGALIPTIGLVTFPLGLLSIFLLHDNARIEEPIRSLLWGLAAFLFLIGLVVTPLSFILGPIFVPFLLTPVLKFLAKLTAKVLSVIPGAGHTRHRRPVDTLAERRRRLYYAIVLYAVAMLIIIDTNSVPSLPAETIVPVASPPFIGYVVGESDTDVTILTAHTRQIIHMDPNKIFSQTVCRQQGVSYSGFFVDTIPVLLDKTDEQHYPRCKT